MSRPEAVKLTNMCMVTDDQGRVLVQNRRDPSWPGLTFPGGHIEPGESLVDSIIREVREETGLTVMAPTLCGVKHFHTLDGVRYLVFLFRASRFEGELRSSEEGEAAWLSPDEFANQRWIPDFEDLLHIFQHDEISELFYERKDGLLSKTFQ